MPTAEIIYDTREAISSLKKTVEELRKNSTDDLVIRELDEIIRLLHKCQHDISDIWFYGIKEVQNE